VSLGRLGGLGLGESQFDIGSESFGKFNFTHGVFTLITFKYKLDFVIKFGSVRLVSDRIYTYPVTDVFGLGDGISHASVFCLTTFLLETVKLGESLSFSLMERFTKQ
jgi:hypothetical protein